MNKRGMQLAINTLVVIVLAIVVLIALTLAFTGAGRKLMDTIRGYGGSDIDNLSKICQSQCDLNNKNSFCCDEKSLGKERVTCLNERLDVDCNINCEGFCSVEGRG